MGYIGKGKHVKSLMSLLFPIVLIRGLGFVFFFLVLFRDGYVIIIGKEEFVVKFCHRITMLTKSLI